MMRQYGVKRLLPPMTSYGARTFGRSSAFTPYKRQRVGTNAKLKRVMRQVAALRPEMKYFIVSDTVSNIDDATGVISIISLIAQGSDDANRIGNQIRVQFISINLKVPGGFGASAATYRVMLVRDNDSNGVVPSISGTANSILTGTQPLSQLLRSNEGRFTVLKQHVFNSNMLGLGGQSPLHTWEFSPTFQMTFRGTAGSQANAAKNALYLVFLSDDAADTIDIAYSATLGFTDV